MRFLRRRELSVGVNFLSNDFDNRRLSHQRQVGPHLPHGVLVQGHGFVHLGAELTGVRHEHVLDRFRGCPGDFLQPWGDFLVEVSDAVGEESALVAVEHAEDPVVIRHHLQDVLAQEPVLFALRRELGALVRRLFLQTLPQADFGEEAHELLVKVHGDAAILLGGQEPGVEPLRDRRLDPRLHVLAPLLVRRLDVLFNRGQRLLEARLELVELSHRREQLARHLQLGPRLGQPVVQLLGPHRAARVPRHARVYRRVHTLRIELFPDGNQLFRVRGIELHGLLLDVSLHADPPRHLVQCLQRLRLTFQPGRRRQRGRVHRDRALVQILDPFLELVVIVVPGSRLDVHEVVIESSQRIYQLDKVVFNLRHRLRNLRALGPSKHRRGHPALTRELFLRLAHLHQVLTPLHERVDLREQRSFPEIPPSGRVVPRFSVHGALRGLVHSLPRLTSRDGVPQCVLATRQVGTVQHVAHVHVRGAPVNHL